MKDYKLTITTANGNQFSGQVYDLFVRGANGDLAILAGHIPFITGVKPGVCRYTPATEEAKESSFEIDGGFITVSPDEVTLICSGYKEITEDRQSK